VWFVAFKDGNGFGSFPGVGKESTAYEVIKESSEISAFWEKWRNITDVFPSSPGAARGFRDKILRWTSWWLMSFRSGV